MGEQVFSRDEIRRAVREALLEALPVEQKKTGSISAPNCRLMKQLLESVQSDGRKSVVVDLSSDRKVNEFAQDLAKCLQEKHVAELVLRGRLKFQTASRAGADQSSVKPSSSEGKSGRPSPNAAAVNGRIETGVLSESKVLALSKTHQRIEVGKGVILTPLAKDRARRLKIEIVRQ